MNPNIPGNVPASKLKNKTYDDMFKETIETFPAHLIIAFLNSTFNHAMPPESVIEPLRTEFNAETRVTSDYILKVSEPDGTVRYFHMEAQTSNDRMAFRMIEYGLRFALFNAKDSADDDILIELPHAVVFYLRDDPNTPRRLNVTIKAPDGQELHYVIPTDLMSDYTPEELLKQDKFPLFQFFMLNFKGKDPEKFEELWLAGCAYLNEMVKAGYLTKSQADKLLENARIVIQKVKHPNEKEVFRKMTMFDTVGVGVDWIAVEREKKEYAAQARHEKAVDTAKKALAKGLSAFDAADISGLPVEEVETFVKH